MRLGNKKFVKLTLVAFLLVGILSSLFSSMAAHAIEFTEVGLDPPAWSFEYGSEGLGASASIEATAIAGSGTQGSFSFVLNYVGEAGSGDTNLLSDYNSADGTGGSTHITVECGGSVAYLWNSNGTKTVDLAISGDFNGYPCSATDVGTEGGGTISVSATIHGMKLVIDSFGVAGPFTIILKDSSGALLASEQVGPFEEVTLDSRIGKQFFNIPVGSGYSVEIVSAADVLIGSATGITVTAGGDANVPIIVAEATYGSDTESVIGEALAAGATCENSNNNVSWLLCPVVQGAADNIGGILGFITRALDFNVGPADTSNGTYRVWNSFKTIANVFFVLVMLFIVYAQATGSMLDAYSVKKMVPRMVIAVIAVQLSFWASSFIIELTNELGRSLVVIIDNMLNIKFGVDDIIVLISGVVLGSTLAIGAAFIGLFAITPIILGLLVSLIAVVFTFAFRTVLITVLVILSPFAFLAWVLPGTQKIFSLWWQNFSKLLLMYPMIVLLIEAGKIVAVASSGGNTQDIGFWGMIYMFAPYLMIPFTFKFAGGAMAAIGQFSNKYKAGVQERAHRRAEPELQKRKQEFLSGTRGSSRGLGKYVNKVGLGIGVGSKSWSKPGSFRGRMDTAQQLAAAARAEDPAFQAMSVNSYALAAGAFGDEWVDEKIEKNKEKLKSETNASKRAEITHDIAALEHGRSLAKSLPNTKAQQQASLMALAKTGYEFEAGQEGYDRLQETVAGLAGGTVKDGVYEGSNPGLYSTLMDSAQYNLRQAGRFDLGGLNHGSHYDFDKGVDKADSYTLGRGSKETIQAGRQKFGMAVKESAEDKRLKASDPAAYATKQQAAATEHLRGVLDSGDREGLNKAMRWRAKLQAAKQGAKGENLTEINGQLAAIDGAVASFGSSRTESPTAAGPPVSAEAQTLRASMLEGERYVSTYDSEQMRRRGGIDPNDPHLEE